MDKETTKKVAAMIASLVDEKAANFKKEIDSVQKTIDKRLSVIESVVEKVAAQKLPKAIKPAKTTVSIDEKDFEKVANRVYNKTSDKISDIEEEFESVKREVYELLGQTRVKLDDTSRYLENLKNKSSEIDDFLKRFSKQTKETTDIAKKLNREVSSIESGINVKINKVEKEISSLNRNSVSKKEMTTKIDKLERSITDSMQKNTMLFESTKNEILKNSGKLEQDFETAKKQFVLKGDFNKVSEKVKNVRDIINTKKELVNQTNQLEKRIAVYDSSMKSAINNLDSWRTLVEDISKRLSGVEASIAGLNYLKEKFSEVEKTTNSNVASLHGKMKILEQYYRNPDSWIGDKINLILSQSIERINNGIAATNQNIVSQKKEFLVLLANLSLTKLSTSEEYSEIFSESRVLEYLLSLLKTSNMLDEETNDYMIDTIVSTRDFWESKNTDIAALIEAILDRVKAI